jgi:hypothetical protein
MASYTLSSRRRRPPSTDGASTDVSDIRSPFPSGQDPSVIKSRPTPFAYVKRPSPSLVVHISDDPPALLESTELDERFAPAVVDGDRAACFAVAWPADGVKFPRVGQGRHHGTDPELVSALAGSQVGLHGESRCGKSPPAQRPGVTSRSGSNDIGGAEQVQVPLVRAPRPPQRPGIRSTNLRGGIRLAARSRCGAARPGASRNPGGELWVRHPQGRPSGRGHLRMLRVSSEPGDGEGEGRRCRLQPFKDVFSRRDSTAHRRSAGSSALMTTVC